MINVCLFERILQRHTAYITEYRFELQRESMAMSRLTEKLAAAAAVAPRQAAKIEARADAVIASEAELEAMTDDAFAGHEALLDEARKGVQDLKHELATMSNNPPLEPSAISLSGPRVLPDGSAGMGDLNQPKAAPDQPTGIEKDLADLDPHVYRKFEAGMPLETAKAVNGS